MLRECALGDISDGRTYELNDMVKADTGNCSGCHKCCTGMGSSIILDPLDIWNLKVNLHKSFETLLEEGYIELNIVDGLILPNLKMNEKNECSFLDQSGRCNIHKVRPGICRIFPLGRVYDGTSFRYFLQKDECMKKNRAKVKIKKWIDTEYVDENQRFISDWHYFIRDIGNEMIVLKKSGKGERLNVIAMYVLNEFFVADLIYVSDEIKEQGSRMPEEKTTTEERLNMSEIYRTLGDKISVARENIGRMF